MSAGGMKDARIIIVLFLATLGITVVTALIAPPEGVGANGPTSFSSAPAGGKAGFLTLRALGYEVHRSFEPTAELRVDPKNTALLITGGIPPSDQDKRALQAFVASGGTALVSGLSGAQFVGVADAGDDRAIGRSPVVIHRVLAPSPIVDDVSEITIPALDDAIAFGPQYVALFAQTREQPLVTTAAVGTGRVVWLSAPTPLMNEHIGRADNLQLLLNVVGRPGQRVVLWDEHYHGNTRSFWSYLVNTPLPWMGAQLALVAAGAVMAFGRRRAPVRPRRDVPRTSPLEFIDMLSALYRRSNATNAAVASARARFLRAVTSVCGVRSDHGDDAVARAVASTLRVDPQRVVRALTASGGATGLENLSWKPAADLSRELQTLTAELYAVRKHRRTATAGHQES